MTQTPDAVMALDQASFNFPTPAPADHLSEPLTWLHGVGVGEHHTWCRRTSDRAGAHSGCPGYRRDRDCMAMFFLFITCAVTLCGKSPWPPTWRCREGKEAGVEMQGRPGSEGGPMWKVQCGGAEGLV